MLKVHEMLSDPNFQHQMHYALARNLFYEGTFLHKVDSFVASYNVEVDHVSQVDKDPTMSGKTTTSPLTSFYLDRNRLVFDLYGYTTKGILDKLISALRSRGYVATSIGLVWSFGLIAKKESRGETIIVNMQQLKKEKRPEKTYVTVELEGDIYSRLAYRTIKLIQSKLNRIDEVSKESR